MNEQLLTAVEIKVIDDASKALASIKGRFEEMGDGIKKQQSFLQQHNEQLKAVSRNAVIAGAAILGAAGLTIKASTDQLRANQQLEAVLKSTKGAAGLTAEELQKMAGAMQDVTNFGDEVVQSGQNILLTFTNIHKNVFPQATEAMLDMSQALGQDLKSSAIQLGKALNDPIQGISALQRVGVSFTDAQKKQIETLIESGKVMEAQKIILGELAREFGGSARAAADPLIQLKNAIGDVAEEVGNAIAPAIRNMAKDIIPVVKQMGEWIKAHPELSSAIGKTIVALGALLLVLGTTGLALSKFITALNALKITSQKVIPALNALKGAIAFLVTPLGLVIAAASVAAIAIVATTKKINAAWQNTASVAAQASSMQQSEWENWDKAAAQLAGNEQKYAQLRAKAQYYILQSTLLTEKQIALIRQHASQDQISAVQHEIDVNNQWAKQAADAAIDFGNSNKQAAENAKTQFGKIGNSAKEEGDSMKDSVKEVQKSIKELEKDYNEVVVDINSRLLTLKTEHKKTMDDLQKNIKEVTDSIQKLSVDYKKSMEELVTAHNKAISEISGEKADTVVKQFQKIIDLQKEIGDFKYDQNALSGYQIATVLANRQDKGQEISKKDQNSFNLTDSQVTQINKVLELRKEQEALVSVLQQNYQLTKDQGEALKNTYGDDQIESIRKIIEANKDLGASLNFSGLTDIEKSFSSLNKKTTAENDDFKKQQAEKNQSFTDELFNLKDQKKELEDRKNVAQATYNAERAELEQTKAKVQEFGNTYSLTLQNVDKVTQDTVDSLKSKLTDLRNVISSIDALMQRKANITGGETITQKAQNIGAAKAANGDTFTQPTLALIGEGKYNEAVVPLPDGRSIPVKQVGSNEKQKSGDITIRIDNVEMSSTMDVNSVFEMLARKLQLYQLRSS